MEHPTNGGQGAAITSYSSRRLNVARFMCELSLCSRASDRPLACDDVQELADLMELDPRRLRVRRSLRRWRRQGVQRL